MVTKNIQAIERHIGAPRKLKARSRPAISDILRKNG
jgi:hypothetical protein